MLRPIGQFNSASTTTNLDHPNFTGSNPNFNPVLGRRYGGEPANGTWTTTATGCRTACGSIWGMPVRSTADGRLYKPLFAILCTDLDGRLNLNAHGSLAAQTVTTTIATL